MSEKKNANPDDHEEMQQRIEELRSEHHDLDRVLNKMAKAKSADQLMVRRLKKRKLLLKDTITRLESQLLPNITA